ncbi:MAG TPA: hypothetical protein VNN20_04590 [Thermodesulfobacteriota bacterium]|nr:hypothetical protein [Thermodesulfobacteriota bacterium]
MTKANKVHTKEMMLLLTVLILALVGGCADRKARTKTMDEEEAKASVKTATSSRENVLTFEALQNAVYRSEYFKDGQVRLTNGKYESAGIVISLDEQMQFGDVTGDRIEDAVVVLVTDTGGNGAFYDLAVVVDENGTPANIASTYLGDRVKIESIYIEAGKVTVSMVMHGETDPDCCPTLKVVKTYQLQGGNLVEQ